jgi:hypothetical protein
VRWFLAEQPIAGLSPEAIRAVLIQSNRLDQVIVRTGDWYTLRGRTGNIHTRQHRGGICRGKWRLARRAAKLLQWVPFIRLIAVSNTLALDNARPESDIDFFIVAQAGRLWTVRFLAAAVLDLFRLRRKGQSITDKICLSFFVTDNALNLEPLRLRPQDPHFMFWLSQIVPLIDRGVFQHYQEANKWIKFALPFALERSEAQVERGRVAEPRLRRLSEFLLKKTVGDRFEHWLKQIQLRKMEANTQSRAKADGTDVVISDTVLKFHEADRRAEYRERFSAALRGLYQQT